ncbi:YbfB/YjiJ family MFS transporter [Bordetella sp. LUAb4]|uniref:YbfB/YjiJ family MFS transporter n=1 Tax=Bordetella sp. LUAb4 TaxID=2843195 RepID=UPI001E2F59F7|nr:YbfB/YjiJ family MFS transporter [Bordetella sp. LUAb4]
MTVESMSKQSATRIALMGMLSVAVAIGIGRFAFTPLLPVMLNESWLSLAEACWLAESNLLGYFLGAILCSLIPGSWLRLTGRQAPDEILALAGLAATAALTLGMAVPWPELWPWLRFLSGIASALAFVFTSSWCLRRLAQQSSTSLAGLIYCGSGVGIVLGGVLVSATVSMGWGAAAGWKLLGCLVGLLVLWIGYELRRGHRQVSRRDNVGDSTRAAASAPQSVARPVESPVPHSLSRSVESLAESLTDTLGSGVGLGWLMFAYGLAGFGYVITATFLPVMAREVIPGSEWVDWIWPIYGISAALGCLASTRMPAHWDNSRLLAVCYFTQSVGVVMGLWWPGVAGFVLSSVLVGTPFTALTLFAFREVRLRWPHNSTSVIGLMTAVYAIGQILSPPLFGALLRSGISHSLVFAWSLHTASAALLMGGLIWFLAARPLPVRNAMRV